MATATQTNPGFSNQQKKELVEIVTGVVEKAIEDKVPPIVERMIEEKVPPIVERIVEAKVPPIVERVIDEKVPGIVEAKTEPYFLALKKDLDIAQEERQQIREDLQGFRQATEENFQQVRDDIAAHDHRIKGQQQMLDKHDYALHPERHHRTAA